MTYREQLAAALAQVRQGPLSDNSTLIVEAAERYLKTLPLDTYKVYTVTAKERERSCCGVFNNLSMARDYAIEMLRAGNMCVEIVQE